MGRPGLSLDKKFRRLAHDLDDFQAGFGRALARGSLELLWDTAYESCTDEVGDAFDVEAAAEWRGPSGRLVKALVEAGSGEKKAGFLEEGGSRWWPEGGPGTYRVHDFWDHAPDYVRKRAEREAEREENGRTIKEIRATAGRLGAAKTNAKRWANVRPVSGKWSANVSTGDETVTGNRSAGVSSAADTPTPTPTPEREKPRARDPLPADLQPEAAAPPAAPPAPVDGGGARLEPAPPLSPREWLSILDRARASTVVRFRSDLAAARCSRAEDGALEVLPADGYAAARLASDLWGGVLERLAREVGVTVRLVPVPERRASP